MPSLRLVAPLGVAAALVGLAAVAVTTTSSPSSSEADPSRGPVATASGGGASVLIYPSLVNVRLVRSEAALARATALVDQGKVAPAIPALTAAQANMKAAWIATKYVIRTTPPPVATDGALAHSSGGAPAGGSYASPQDTALAVFSLEHDVVTTSVALLGAGTAALDTALSTTSQAAADTRDAAVRYIHRIAPPPVAGDGRVHANASGGAVASTWDTTMPSVLPLLDDELQVIRGTRKINKTLSATSSTFLNTIGAQDRKTKVTINTFWPPIVGDG
jgi:hypothetical protein